MNARLSSKRKRAPRGDEDKDDESVKKNDILGAKVSPDPIFGEHEIASDPSCGATTTSK